MVFALNGAEMDFHLNILHEEDLVEATGVLSPFSGYTVRITAKGFNRVPELLSRLRGVRSPNIQQYLALRFES
jgi:hypothetical protein